MAAPDAHDAGTYERELARFERNMNRFERDLEREMESHARAVEEHGRAVERSHRNGPRPPALMTIVQARDEVLYERSFDFRAGDELVVGLSSEDVVIETGPGSGASVRVVGRGAGAREEFERRRFDARYAGGELRVRTDPPRGPSLRRNRAEFTVTIRIPEQAQVDVSTASGDVRMARVGGDLAEVSTASGNISLATVRADRISLSAASGDIAAGALEGDVRVSTSSGNVTVDRIAGGSATLTASSGDLRVDRMEASRFSARAASGDIVVGGVTGAASATTSSGDVTIRFARSTATEVNTASGEVSLTFPRGAGADVQLSGPDVEIDGALSFDGSRQRRSVRGRLGAGGPDVTVSTASGDIALSAR